MLSDGFQDATYRVQRAYNVRVSWGMQGLMGMQGLVSGFMPFMKNRLLLRSGGKVIFVEPHTVDWIEASDNYVVFHAGAESHVVRMTMKNLEMTLDPALFVRIHRSLIVNIDRVRELRPLPHGDYSVLLQNGAQLTLTRSYRDRVQKLLQAQLS
jgi:two-component system LytT family response regulator